MTTSVFVSMSDSKMASLIEGAERRVAVAVPAFRQQTADALLKAITRLGSDSVGVVMDCDENVFRLGYGEIEAVKRLREGGCVIRQCSGLRIGGLVCDDQAWVFAPTALYVQDEVHSDETPNAVSLAASDVQGIVGCILQPQLGSNGTGPAPDETQTERLQATDIIGHEEIPQQLFAQTHRALEQAPPVAFDVARRVRVFQPYIQYVDVSLRGCAIQRHRIEVPSSLQGIAPDAELASRLRTTFEVIEQNSDVSSKKLEDEPKKIRDDFTRSLGKPWGRVILRAARPLFDDQIKELRERLVKHKSTVEERLAKCLDESRDRLKHHFLPLVRESAPRALLGQILKRPPTDEQIMAWLDAELLEAFPQASELLADMTLDVQFRDVTYETLKEKEFAERLRDAYPQVKWDKPFQEFDAVGARGSK